jgi:hypothetical protein
VISSEVQRSATQRVRELTEALMISTRKPEGLSLALVCDIVLSQTFKIPRLGALRTAQPVPAHDEASAEDDIIISRKTKERKEKKDKNAKPFANLSLNDDSLLCLLTGSV